MMALTITAINLEMAGMVLFNFVTRCSAQSLVSLFRVINSKSHPASRLRCTTIMSRGALRSTMKVTKSSSYHDGISDG